MANSTVNFNNLKYFLPFITQRMIDKDLPSKKLQYFRNSYIIKIFIFYNKPKIKAFKYQYINLNTNNIYTLPVTPYKLNRYVCTI